MAKIWTVTDETADSNCYIIEQQKKVIVIDPNQEESLIHLMENQKWQVQDIFLTHEHCDHTQGLNSLRKYSGAPVIAQEECSKGIQDSVRNMSRIMGTYLYFRNGEKQAEEYEPFVCRAAEETFSKEKRWIFEGHEFRAVSLPGHTPGSSCLIMDKIILFSGDYLLPGEKTVTRLPGGSTEDYDKIAKPWFKSLPLGMRVYPGHGKPYLLNEEVMKQNGL